MVTQAGNDVYPSYVKARTALRQNSSVFAHKAEIYIDWASDLGRDPSTQQTLDGDPLTETLLGNYNFDCDAPRNFPSFAGSSRAASAPAAPRCRGDYLDVNNPLRTSLCARRPDTGPESSTIVPVSAIASAQPVTTASSESSSAMER